MGAFSLILEKPVGWFFIPSALSEGVDLS